MGWDLDPEGNGGFAPTCEEGFIFLASRKGQSLTITAPGPSRPRASKAFKIVWIHLQPMVSPPGICLHVSTPVRGATVGSWTLWLAHRKIRVECRVKL